jgi:predicted MFS family arabinose efflux permease
VIEQTSSPSTGAPERVVGPVAALVVATVSIALAALPVFLLGALAVFIRAELGFGEAALGVSASLYYLTSALSSVPGGRLTTRVGVRNSIALAAVGSTVALFGVAVLGRSWLVLTGFMMVAGAVNGVALPASNVALARRVPARHQGVSFGLKQSAGPIATLLAGASVPALGATVGWRWAFVLAGLIALPLVFVGRGLGRRSGKATKARSGRLPTAALVALAVAAALAVVGGSSLAAFYVESAVASGRSPAVAGTLLAGGSVLGIGARIAWGWLSGVRHAWHVSMIVWMLVIGSLGFAALGRAGSVSSLAIATVLVFGFGWAWPGIFNFAIVSRTPEAPAVASGIVATGTYAGGTVGPVMFGALVEWRSYEVAWLAVAGSMLAAAVLMRTGGRMLERSRGHVR